MSKFINPFTDVCFMKVEDIVDIASMSKEDRIRYDESIKVYRDRLAIMEFERMKGKAEGIAARQSGRYGGRERGNSPQS